MQKEKKSCFILQSAETGFAIKGGVPLVYFNTTKYISLSLDKTWSTRNKKVIVLWGSAQ